MPTMLTKQDKEDIKDIVVEVITDVTMPAFENISNKLDKVESRLDRVEMRVDQIDRKLDLFSAKSLDHDQKLIDHEKRIKSLETLTTPQ